MKQLSRGGVALTLLLCLGATDHSFAQASDEASKMVEEFELRSAAVPIGKHPHWKPGRVVVNLPSAFSSRIPQFEEQLAAVAGDIELVIDRSDNFMLSAEALASADGVIGVCTPSTMANADKNLMWFQSYFVGMDSCVGLNEHQLSNVTFTNTKRLSGPAIAEHSIAMMMAIARGLPGYQDAQRKGKWQPAISGTIRFGEIKGKTILIAGLGGIGSQIAWRAHGLGMRVIATRHSSRKGPDYVDYVGLSPELYKLAGQADVIVNALPLTAETTGLFNEKFFSGVRPGSIFLSVGRGKSTVTKDLVSALESGQLYGAGLDVVDPEPLPEDHPLWQMDNVIITPHVSAVTPQSLRRTSVLIVENLRRYIAGEAMLNVVDIHAGY